MLYFKQVIPKSFSAVTYSNNVYKIMLVLGEVVSKQQYRKINKIYTTSFECGLNNVELVSDSRFLALTRSERCVGNFTCLEPTKNVTYGGVNLLNMPSSYSVASGKCSRPSFLDVKQFYSSIGVISKRDAALYTNDNVYTSKNVVNAMDINNIVAWINMPSSKQKASTPGSKQTSGSKAFTPGSKQTSGSKRKALTGKK